MTQLQAIIAAAASIVTVLGALGAGCIMFARAVWRMSSRAHDLHSAVKENTEATHDLSTEFRVHATDVTGRLTDHEIRITKLERSGSP